MKLVIKIKGLDCANCALQLENSIKKIDGMENVTINFMTEKLIVESVLENKAEIIEKIKKVVKKEEPDVIIEEA